MNDYECVQVASIAHMYIEPTVTPVR